MERTLSPDGDILLPLLGKINLGGLYIVEAEDKLQQLASAKLGLDRVAVGVTLVSNSGPVEFSGAVGHSGSSPFHAGMTLEEVVKLAEPTVAADLDSVEITAADGKKVKVNLANGGGSTKLKPGDRIFFPQAAEANEVLILGAVARPGSKNFKDGMTLRELISIAGGITPHGEAAKLKFERKGEKPKTLDANSTDADTKLVRGDVITVPAIENGRYVTVQGFIAKPGLVQFREGMTLTQAIKEAGGLLMLAGSDSITVKRLGSWRHKFDYGKIVAKAEEDLVLQPADIVEVPAAKPHKPETAKPAAKEKPKPRPVVPPR